MKMQGDKALRNEFSKHEKRLVSAFHPSFTLAAAQTVIITHFTAREESLNRETELDGEKDF